jgi:succinate-semialdehyde dehydrogenase/glutarate-semialdehyde dehydrogenase
MHGFQPWNPQFYINPLYLPASGDAPPPVFNPATGEPIGLNPCCTKDDVHTAVAAANVAHTLWRLLDTQQRQALMQQLADSIAADSALNRQIAAQMTRELALSAAEARAELDHCAALLRYCAKLLDRLAPGSAPVDSASCQLRYEPYGVSVHILPFTLGIALLGQSVAAALAAGNSCLVKPAPNASLSTLAFMQHFACLPAGLVSCIPGDATTGQWLLQSCGTHAVAFTGSAGAASAVAVTCAELLKPCVIESAGRGAMIVAEDADLALAAACAARAAFSRSGQSCLSIQYFFVDARVHDPFVRQFIEHTRALYSGHSAATSVAPLISDAARHKLQRLVRDAVAKGARLLAGEQALDAALPGGSLVPVILGEVDDDMAITEEECLGPVAIIRRASDLGAAVQLANDCPASFEVTLFANDPAPALLLAQRLLSTRVRINPAPLANHPDSDHHWTLSRLAGDLSPEALDGFRRRKRLLLGHAARPATQAAPWGAVAE